MSSSHSKDYISDVYMDISHQFFPLPSVTVPNITISRPSFRKYNFESERKAIADYEKNKATLAVKMDEPIGGTAAGVAVAVNSEEIQSKRPPSVPLSGVITAETCIRRVHSNVILEPSRAVAVTSQQQQNRKPIKPAVNTFEEFESKPNLFDLLELRTIDDKAALEQILANAPPRPPPPALPLPTGESSVHIPVTTRPLPSLQSASNTGMNMSGGTDGNARSNLYHLTSPATLQSCNGSFGVSIVPSASFRHNL